MGPKPVLHCRRPPPLRNRREVPRRAPRAGRSRGRRGRPELLPDDARRNERSGAADSAHAPACERVGALISPRRSSKRRWAIHFDIVERTGTNAKAAWEHVQMDGAQSVFAFGTAADGQWIVAKLRNPGAMTALAPDQSADWARAGRERAAQIGVGPSVAREEIGGAPICKYVPHCSVRQPTRPRRRNASSRVWCRPPTMGHVERIAGLGEKMPPNIDVLSTRSCSPGWCSTRCEEGLTCLQRAATAHQMRMVHARMTILIYLSGAGNVTSSLAVAAR